MTASLVDAIRGVQQAILAKGFAVDITYSPNDSTTPVALRAFVRGLSSDDLFVEALQQDQVAVLNAAQFLALLPARKWPAKLDRIRTASGRSYVVEAWRGAPEGSEVPVFYKCLIRGGGQ